MDFYVRDNCRLCLSDKLTRCLELTPTPPANEFITQEKLVIKQDEFPLYLVSCEECGHIQLPVVVDPLRLFKDYVYVSGTSPIFLNHFKNYAKKIIKELALTSNDLIVEIGSNDGSLLRYFKEFGIRIVGVDPAEKISQFANDNGMETINSFFDEKTVGKITEDYGKATVIIANNVFAHADDLRGIVKNIKKLLDVHGYFIFEVSYVVDVLNKTTYDMTYHEHVAYHHLGPLVKFFNEFGMSLYNCERIDTHGGSIRCYVINEPDISQSSDLKFEIANEVKNGLYVYGVGGNINSQLNRFISFKSKIDDLGDNLRNYIENSKKSGRLVAAFGAPAKATTLMYQFDLGKDDFSFIVDDSPWKQGLYTPGKHIPVMPSSYLYENPIPDDLVILAWNFAESIMDKHSAFLNGSRKFIVPLPEFKVYGISS